MQQSFQVTAPLLVTVICPAGDVVADTVDGDTADVEITALRNDEATREAIENAVVELRRDGHELVVEVPKRNGSFFGREARIRVAIRVPHGSDLSFRTASADVAGNGTFGEVRGKTASGDLTLRTAATLRVESASGDVRAEEVTGDAEVKTASGDVNLGHVGGTVSASVVSGDLRIRAAANGVSAGAVSGDIDLDAVERGDIEVRTVSGDVTVGVRAGARVHVDVTTVSGDLRSDVALDDAPGEGGDDGPLVDIRGRTVSGDLRVRRVVA
jgi:DUF4097 and DUF4098 domain-containing protein YvlB